MSSEKRQRTAAVLVRFLPEERRQLTVAADARGLSVCEFIRRAIQREVAGGGQ